jgi:hypothetical protein
MNEAGCDYLVESSRIRSAFRAAQSPLQRGPKVSETNADARVVIRPTCRPLAYLPECVTLWTLLDRSGDLLLTGIRRRRARQALQLSLSSIARPMIQSLSSSDRNESSFMWATRCAYDAFPNEFVMSVPQ